MPASKPLVRSLPEPICCSKKIDGSTPPVFKATTTHVHAHDLALSSGFQETQGLFMVGLLPMTIEQPLAHDRLCVSTSELRRMPHPLRCTPGFCANHRLPGSGVHGRYFGKTEWLWRKCHGAEIKYE